MTIRIRLLLVVFVDDNDLTRKGGGFKASFKVGGIMGGGKAWGALPRSLGDNNWHVRLHQMAPPQYVSINSEKEKITWKRTS